MMPLCKAQIWISVLPLFILTQHPSHFIIAAAISADPPENIKIIDPGHLGYLNIEWSRPSSLKDVKDCNVRYQLSYYDTYAKRWKSVRTPRLSYVAQFDLEKPIEIKMLTLLKGACTNETEVLGEEVKIKQNPEQTGLPNSKIRNFACVYFNKNYMDCTWNPGSEEPSGSKFYLYYWHRDMQETEECPEYIPSPELRRGCRFPSQSLLEFSEFNICVNGSSMEGYLEPAFYSLSVQNQVKPAAVTDLQLSTADKLLQAAWKPPADSVPEQCLEYELELTTVSHDGKKQQHTTLLEETTSDFPLEDKAEQNCIRVRSKVNIYCADEGYWSDWSQSRCIPEVETAQKPAGNSLAYTLAITLFILVLIICLTSWMLKEMWKKRKEQKYVIYSLYQEKVQNAILPILNL